MTPSASREEFVARYGAIYEHSLWVAEQAWQRQPASAAELPGLMREIVDQASHASQLALILAHPDLADRTARADLTAASDREQSGAGLDRCNEQEFEEFQSLNRRYKERFGFPFVIAVSGLHRDQILAAFRHRLSNAPEQEFVTALEQIHKIAEIRLRALGGHAETWHASPVNLADPRLGAAVTFATDDFFAAKERLIEAADPVFVPDKYDAHGKWMDGWESRRRRDHGHDYCVIQLGQPALLDAVEIDTRHFVGNYPPAARVEAISSAEPVPPPDAPWQEIVTRIALSPDSKVKLALTKAGPWTHVRLHIYPDGGVARLRLFGRFTVDWRQRDTSQAIDVAAIENGACPIVCNDEHFGRLSNILAPGPGINMGDGWETRRRRDPGHDWAIVRLAHPAQIARAIVDTAFFKGNFPDRVSIQASAGSDKTLAQLVADSAAWPELLPEQALAADREHHFQTELVELPPVQWVRINLIPDGGISRLRLFGHIAS